ncbi:MAG: sortase [Clostridia bacterium]|nr:sortase [Clostridia bacterium]
MQLFISLIMIISFSIYLLYFYINRIKDKNISNTLLNTFSLERLYSKSENYTTVELNKNGNYFVIGIIEIPKINIKYPILSDVNDELLKISACRFYGPYPNKIGNLCIAGHNYDNNSFFSNLYKLDIGDVINIYDSNKLLVTYSIYNKFETSKSDTSCTNQNTNGKREITLVTCNNINKNRLIVKAIEQKITAKH